MATEGLKKPEEEIPQQNPESDQIKQEAADLEGKLSEKTFGERVVSEYQTKKSKVRGTELERGAAFRFERGQIYKGYKILRTEIREAEKRGEDTTSKKKLLEKIRERARVMERDLDELNRQFYENVRDVEIETEFGRFTVPVVELDLKKDKDGKEINPEEDDRIPDVFLGGIATQAHQSACFSMARALDGHKVYVPMNPEQPAVKKPANFSETLGKQPDLRIHAEIAKKIIENLGLERFNLLGHSTGATTILEMAKDPELKGLNDLVSMEPLGLQNMGLLRLGIGFGLKGGLKQTMLSSEARIKTMSQGAPEGQGELGLFARTANILSKKHFSPEDFAEVSLTGSFQVWIGTESPIVDNKIAGKFFTEMEALRQERNPGVKKSKLYKVAGADHVFAMTHPLGLSEIIDGEKPDEQVIKVKKKDLQNSAMARILKGIKNR